MPPCFSAETSLRAAWYAPDLILPTFKAAGTRLLGSLGRFNNFAKFLVGLLMVALLMLLLE